MDTKIYFEKWSEKLSIPVEEIQNEFNNILANEKQSHPNNDDEAQQKRALQRLVLLYKKQLRSPAIGFEGMIIGIGDLFDTVKRLRTSALDIYRENPQEAIANNVVNENGEPLDTREVFGTGRQNSGFGKPLPEHSYIRNVIGIALRTNVQEAPKMFSMTLNGSAAELCNAPMFVPVKFRAINKSDENSDKFVLNGSSVTRFEQSDKIKMPSPLEVLKKTCGEMFVPIEKAEQYHQQNKDDFNRLALFEGDVSIISEEPTQTGSKMMIIEDPNQSLEDIGIPGMTCWVPKVQVDNIDFAEGSKVIVVGRTAQGKSRENPNELGDVMLNVLGVYSIPEFKVELEVQSDNEEEVITEQPKEETEKKEEIQTELPKEVSSW